MFLRTEARVIVLKSQPEFRRGLFLVLSYSWYTSIIYLRPSKKLRKLQILQMTHPSFILQMEVFSMQNDLR